MSAHEPMDFAPLIEAARRVRAMLPPENVAALDQAMAEARDFFAASGVDLSDPLHVKALIAGMTLGDAWPAGGMARTCVIGMLVETLERET